MDNLSRKKVIFVADTKKILQELPDKVRRHIGYALSFAQAGQKHEDSKPLKGFKGASVYEIVTDHKGDTCRTFYTVEFAEYIVVVHIFQKKSHHGISTPKQHINLLEARLQQIKKELS